MVGRDGELAGVVEQVVEQQLRGSSGKNDSRTEAAPALRMLPKLLDVPISTYLIVLAKIRRPSAMPSATTSRLFSSRRRRRRHGRRRRRCRPRCHVGLVQRQRVVDAVAEKADRAAARGQARTSRAFCSGETRASTAGVSSRRPARRRRVCRSRSPERGPAGGGSAVRPTAAANRTAAPALSPVAMISRTSSRASLASDSPTPGFGGSSKINSPCRVRWRSSAALR